MQTLPPESTQHDRSSIVRLLSRVGLTLVIAGFATFWIWALFFASKEAVNRVDDRDWARAPNRSAPAPTSSDSS